MKFTDYLAIYAAILSTLVFAWSVLQSRPRIKVDIIFGIEGSGYNKKSGVYIFIRNLSSQKVHLASIDVLYAYKCVGLKERITHLWKFKRIPRRLGWVTSNLSNYSVESGCPVWLEARTSHKVFLSELTLEAVLAGAIHRSIIACVQDQLWNNVYSSTFKYPLHKSK